VLHNGLGYIGVGNRGDQLHGAFLEYGDCQTAAMCELRDDHVDSPSTNPEPLLDVPRSGT
jgi:hypothetical protein